MRGCTFHYAIDLSNGGMMYMRRRDSLWFGFIALAFAVTAAGCSSGGAKGSATGLASGTACVSVGGKPEVCATTAVRASRTISAGYSITIDVSHSSTGTDCFSYPADTFSVSVSIPDGVPLPYQATQRPGSAGFGTGTCYWLTNNASVVDGTIFQTATDGGLNVEGDLTVPYTIDNAMYQCGDSCPASNSAHFRFNAPL
jgi:hypothetical protein